MELTLTQYRKFFFLISIAALLVAIVSILVRPLSPVNETLYTGVAWDMWTQHHILVPLVNGHTYNQKPPLYFWLVELGWKLFGVNSWWPRLLPALCSLGSIYLTALTAKKLFKQFPSIQILSAFILLGMAYWAYYSPRARLDQLLTVCIMLSLYGLVKSIRQERYGFVLFGVGNGLALLTKGPICFIFTGIPLVMAPFLVPALSQRKRDWFLKTLGSLIISSSIVACWAIPIIMTQPQYAKSILWDQTISRLLHNQHHVQTRIWYYYFVRLPLLIMPWLLWPALWKGFRNTRLKSDVMLRWLTYSMLTILGVLSFIISQKGSRFLIPFMPLIAILFAYYLVQTDYQHPVKYNRLVGSLFILLGGVVFIMQPVLMLLKIHPHNLSLYHGLWGVVPIAVGLLWYQLDSAKKLNTACLIALSSCSITVLLYGIILHMQSQQDDMRPIGTVIRELQASGAPVAFITHYDDRFEFAGRITQPLLYIQDWPNALLWGGMHPNGFIIQTVKEPIPKTFIQPFYEQPYRHKHVVQIWRGMDFVLRNERF